MFTFDQSNPQAMLSAINLIPSIPSSDNIIQAGKRDCFGPVALLNMIELTSIPECVKLSP